MLDGTKPRKRHCMKPNRGKSKLKKSKDKAWMWLSRYIRLRDSVNGICKCVTCDTVKPWKQMQAGHFIPAGRGNAVRYVEENIHAQCYRCNINLGGFGAVYYPFMVEKYGQEFVDDLIVRSHGTLKISVQQFEDMAAEFEEKARALGYDD